MITNEYKSMHPIFKTQVLVNQKPDKPEQCPFYGEQAVSYKQHVDGTKSSYYLTTGIKECCFFSQDECDPSNCMYLMSING